MEASAAAEVRTGFALLAAGAAPFAAGALVHEGAPAALFCPFRAMTGLPCPLCGASRAFVLAARGDDGFLRYGAVWVALAALAVAAGTVALVGAAARRPVVSRALPAVRGPRAAVAVIAAVGAVAWAWALAHSETIAG